MRLQRERDQHVPRVGFYCVSQRHYGIRLLRGFTLDYPSPPHRSSSAQSRIGLITSAFSHFFRDRNICESDREASLFILRPSKMMNFEVCGGGCASGTVAGVHGRRYVFIWRRNRAASAGTCAVGIAADSAKVNGYYPASLSASILFR